MKKNIVWLTLGFIIILGLMTSCASKSNYEEGLALYESDNTLLNIYDDAVEYFTLAIDEEDHVLESYYYRAFSYLAEPDFENAQSDFEAILKIDPNREDIQEMIDIFIPFYERIYTAKYPSDFNQIMDELSPIIDERSTLPLANFCMMSIDKEYVLPLLGQINTDYSKALIRKIHDLTIDKRDLLVIQDIIYFSRDEAGIPLLIKDMERDDGALRYQAIKYLGEWEAKDALRPMKKLLSAELKKDHADLYLIDILNEAIDKIK